LIFNVRPYAKGFRKKGGVMQVMGTISGVAAASCTTAAALAGLGVAPFAGLGVVQGQGAQGAEAAAAANKEKLSFFFDTAPAKVGCCKSNLCWKSLAVSS